MLTKILKKIVPIGFFCGIALLGFLVATGEIPWNEKSSQMIIAGDTPFEKVESMVKIFNQTEGNDFLKAYFIEYSKNQLWKYSILITDDKLFGQISQDQEQEKRRQIKLALYWLVIRDLFVKTIEWDETAKGVIVSVTLPIPVIDSELELPFQGFIFIANEERVKNIRKYPQDWAKWLGIQEPEKMYTIPQSILSSLMKGEKPESVPNGKTEEKTERTEKGEVK